MEGVCENENAGSNQRLQTKIENFCLEVQFRAWLFFPVGLWVFANSGQGLRVLVPPKLPSFLNRNLNRTRALTLNVSCLVAARGGGGALGIFVRRGCAVFRVSFSPIFSRTGYQKKANFLEQVVKTCQKRKFCYNVL